jgi:hypothetical protein
MNLSRNKKISNIVYNNLKNYINIPTLKNGSFPSDVKLLDFEEGDWKYRLEYGMNPDVFRPWVRLYIKRLDGNSFVSHPHFKAILDDTISDDIRKAWKNNGGDKRQKNFKTWKSDYSSKGIACYFELAVTTDKQTSKESKGTKDLSFLLLAIKDIFKERRITNVYNKLNIISKIK